MPRKSLSPLARQAVSDVVRETGHVLTVDDFEHIAALSSLAEKIERPTDKAETEILSLPVPCGGSVFATPSLAKLYWYAICGSQWFRGDDDMLEMCFGFILAIDNTSESVRGLSTPELAKKTVRDWWSRLDATAEEYIRARDAVWVESDDGDDGECDFGPTCALLAREYGENPKWWFYDADINLVRSMLVDHRETIEHELRERRKASKAGAGKPIAPPASPSMAAQKRFRIYKNKLRERWAKMPQFDSAPST